MSECIVVVILNRNTIMVAKLSQNSVKIGIFPFCLKFNREESKRHRKQTLQEYDSQSYLRRKWCGTITPSTVRQRVQNNRDQ